MDALDVVLLGVMKDVVMAEVYVLTRFSFSDVLCHIYGNLDVDVH